MNILITGATGFIGRHLVPVLCKRGHSVTAVGRDVGKARSMSWWTEVDFISCDIHRTSDISDVLGRPEVVVHLAWAGLPDYKSLHHFENNLLADYNFIRTLVEGGTQHVLVAGTCLEYGMQSGALTESLATIPTTSYGLAKDSLRKFLQALQRKITFNLQWVRLFYTYGDFQNQNSLLSQLDKAIDNDEQFFNMSRGEQLRDYLPVEEVAERLVLLVEHPDFDGIVNCCKGTPISVRRLVEEHIKKRGSGIKLNLGHYPYPDYEPMAFWGDSSRLDSLLNGFSKRDLMK